MGISASPNCYPRRANLFILAGLPIRWQMNLGKRRFGATDLPPPIDGWLAFGGLSVAWTNGRASPTMSR